MSTDELESEAVVSTEYEKRIDRDYASPLASGGTGRWLPADRPTTVRGLGILERIEVVFDDVVVEPASSEMLRSRVELQ